VASVFLLAADLALGISNSQDPILVFLPVISLVALRELLIVDSLVRSRGLSVMVILTFLLSTLTIVRETSYIASTYWSKYAVNRGDAKARHFNSPLLENIYVPSSNKFLPNYPLIMNDGLMLLKEHIAPDNKLVTLSFSNPFNFVFGLQPATGDSLCWHGDRTYTISNHPQAERVFSNADLIIINKRELWNKELWPIYQDYIQRHFIFVEQSNFWILYKRGSY
jgi:hypothetical protein